MDSLGLAQVGGDGVQDLVSPEHDAADRYADGDDVFRPEPLLPSVPLLHGPKMGAGHLFAASESRQQSQHRPTAAALTTSVAAWPGSRWSLRYHDALKSSIGCKPS